MAEMSKQQSINNCCFTYPSIWVKNKIYRFYQCINPAESFYTAYLIPKRQMCSKMGDSKRDSTFKENAPVYLSLVLQEKIKRTI